jgi:uncharacterized membrane protein
MDAPHMDPLRNDLEALRKLVAELTARVYQIERRLAMDAGPAVEPHPAPTPPVRPVEPSVPPQAQQSAPAFPAAVPHASPRSAQPAYTKPDVNLESRIGTHWLNRIGIAALLIGISYFLKLAFDSNWIGPAGRVAIGLLAGIGLVVWSERFRSKGYVSFSYSLKAVGIGALYLSLWAAFQVYGLIPGSAAFLMMLVVTAATAAMALTQDAQLLAVFALTGGFSTPVMLSTGQNRETALFAYVLLLDLGMLALVAFKPWRWLLVLSYAGTLLLYLGWYSKFYERGEFSLTLIFATLFFAVFAIAPLIAAGSQQEIAMFASITPIISFVNAGVYFLQAYTMVAEIDKSYMAWFALALAGVYIALSRQVHRPSTVPGQANLLRLLHLALAIGFSTVAIPIRLDAHWITIGWFVEAGVLLWVGNRTNYDLVNAFALGALALGVARLLLIDNFYSTQLIFNMRMATYAVAVLVLGVVAWYGSQRTDDAAQTVTRVALVSINLLSLIALSHEVADYYSRQMMAAGIGRRRWNSTYASEWQRIGIARDFTYSALWMAYGAMLMVIGFVRRSAFVRWQALLLIALTILKVFVYDVSELDRVYRILSFIVLGTLLLLISFVYHRDWLQLSAKSKQSAAGSA